MKNYLLILPRQIRAKSRGFESINIIDIKKCELCLTTFYLKNIQFILMGQIRGELT